MKERSDLCRTQSGLLAKMHERPETQLKLGYFRRGSFAIQGPPTLVMQAPAWNTAVEAFPSEAIGKNRARQEYKPRSGLRVKRVCSRKEGL